jgi:site-specific DNA recombinase
MKKAILYIRVSTDEQADKGYSQRDQHERLMRYCEQHVIVVSKVIFEDYSAKTFNRPEWSKMLAAIKKGKDKTDTILVTKWDRFSRNVSESYSMIGILAKYDVRPFSIEQPLDMSIPESKMMLAIYLAASEVDNDRRALNVFYGMRRAKKEGRWMATAPVGYENLTTPQGQKYIAPYEKKAVIIKWAFKEITHNNLTLEEIRRQANRLGLNTSRANFWRLVRNPVYCGKLIIKQHKDEEAYMVDGQHEPLISEALFYEAQDVLNGRKRPLVAVLKPSLKSLPLRGFIRCPTCHKMLTGSSSKGKYQHYFYYHCDSVCGARFNAVETNKKFLDLLRSWVINPGAVELFRLVISSVYKTRTRNESNARTQVLNDLVKENEKLAKARGLLLDGDIDSADYKSIKVASEAQIARLEAKLQEISEQKIMRVDIDGLIDKIINSFSKLDELFAFASVEKQRHIVSSLFPEKINFDGFEHRTPKINIVVKVIYLINSALEGKSNGKTLDFEALSRGVVPTRIELISRV